MIINDLLFSIFPASACCKQVRQAFFIFFFYRFLNIQ
jgi:hypothetical protein